MQQAPKRISRVPGTEIPDDDNAILEEGNAIAARLGKLGCKKVIAIDEIHRPVKFTIVEVFLVFSSTQSKLIVVHLVVFILDIFKDRRAQKGGEETSLIVSLRQTVGCNIFMDGDLKRSGVSGRQAQRDKNQDHQYHAREPFAAYRNIYLLHGNPPGLGVRSEHGYPDSNDYWFP